ncbi:hypothetical protein FB451DRAFT_1182981 [Mycena latifolia]|nr:hypothetical protein FB451DRAFT_1182981 [Mycena latifolia]
MLVAGSRRRFSLMRGSSAVVSARRKERWEELTVTHDVPADEDERKDHVEDADGPELVIAAPPASCASPEVLRPRRQRASQSASHFLTRPKAPYARKHRGDDITRESFCGGKQALPRWFPAVSARGEREHEREAHGGADVGKVVIEDCVLEKGPARSDSSQHERASKDVRRLRSARCRVGRHLRDGGGGRYGSGGSEEAVHAVASGARCNWKVGRVAGSTTGPSHFLDGTECFCKGRRQTARSARLRVEVILHLVLVHGFRLQKRSCQGAERRLKQSSRRGRRKASVKARGRVKRDAVPASPKNARDVNRTMQIFGHGGFPRGLEAFVVFACRAARALRKFVKMYDRVHGDFECAAPVHHCLRKRRWSNRSATRMAVRTSTVW